VCTLFSVHRIYRYTYTQYIYIAHHAVPVMPCVYAYVCSLLTALCCHHTLIHHNTLLYTCLRRYAARVLNAPEVRYASGYGSMFYVNVEFMSDGSKSLFPMHHTSKVTDRHANAEHLSWQIVDDLPTSTEASVEQCDVPKRRSLNKK
jgi:hypothetical protein